MHGSQGLFRKTNPFEESIRVPMIFGGRNPLYGHHHGRTNHMVNHVDLAPTSLGLCGIAKPEWMDGTDYAGCRLINGTPASGPDSAFLQLVVPTGHGDSTGRAWRGVVTRDGWKYVCLEHQPWLLFNLNEDPYEQVNHALNPAYNVRRRQLQDRLAQWIADTGDSFALPAS